MAWDAKLIQPVVTPNGQKLVTLMDAYKHILTLSNAEQRSELIQGAAKALIMAAEHRGPMLTAQSGAAHAVHGPKQLLNRVNPDRPWLKRKSG